MNTKISNYKSKIFISSTYEDFEKIRKDLLEEFHKIDQPIEAMEFFGAQAGEPLNVCLNKLKTCHIYLGIIGRRYGTIDTKTNKSFTQREYELAYRLYRKETLKDIWIYLPSDDCEFPVKHTEKDPVKLDKLEKFIDLIKKHTVEYYHNKDDLKSKIFTRIIKEILKNKNDDTSLSNVGEPEYDNYLNFTYGVVNIEGFEFFPSDILRTMDKVAYRQCFLDWQSSGDK